MEGLEMTQNRRDTDNSRFLKHYIKMIVILSFAFGLMAGMALIREFPEFSFMRVTGGLIADYWTVIAGAIGASLPIAIKNWMTKKPKA